MALNPADEKCSGALFEIGNAHPFSEKVVAVQLDEGIEIDDDHGQPGEQNELVTELVDPLPRLCVRPYHDGHTAKHHLDPYSGDDGGHALQPAGRDPGFGDVYIECGRQVKKHQTHAVDFAPVVLAGESMSALMNENRSP